MIDNLIIFTRAFVISFGVFCSGYLLYDLVVTSGSNVHLFKKLDYTDQLILSEIRELRRERRQFINYVNRKCVK